ncbi:hypothetical protein RY972_01925 [Aeromonas allosaccharophila]|uniref:Uncharacterized protein n=1 Tax=Aeromonas allosaccharophila TaxID=656 RepID=A0ABZ0FC06_9GAMM|nr:hypothetical protein [Aeromonas allosaccharophila]WOE66903.1 hypothetical protein RY972_01925 [Aeromonas allosaccharophila]
MRSRNSPAIDKAPGSRSLSFYRRLALLFALLATSSSVLALSLHDLDPAFERCEAIKSQHSATLPAKSDPFWLLKREQQATVLIYLHEKSMERCTAAEVDALALKAFHQAVAGDRSFLDTLIKARTTTLTPAQQTQLQQVGQTELERLAGMKEFALPFSLSNYLKQL